MRRVAFFSIMVSALVLAACAAGNLPPAWINNPGEGAVGHAGMNVKGHAQQIKMATSRAREELAARYGVAINSVQIFEQHASGLSGASSMKGLSEQTISNVLVKSRVKEAWCEPISGECWVWVLPE